MNAWSKLGVGIAGPLGFEGCEGPSGSEGFAGCSAFAQINHRMALNPGEKQ